MRIRMLGTGYGECMLKKRASKEYRGRGGVLIDDTLLIDAPADLLDVADELGISDMLKTVTDIIISHSHEGHFSPEVIDKMAKKRKIRIYASREVLVQLSDNPNIIKYEIGVFVQFAVGAYYVATLPSNHTTANLSEDCFNFLITGDRCLFYALDGVWINGRAWNVLKLIKLDAVICDAALELQEASEKNLYHNDIGTLARIKRIYEQNGVANEKTRFILSHVPTDKKREIHDELSPIAAKLGMTVAYDGYFARI